MSERKRTIKDDARVLLGIPPHDGGGNICRSDGYFAKDCERHWGQEKFAAACKSVQKTHEKGMAAYRKAAGRS